MLKLKRILLISYQIKTIDIFNDRLIGDNTGAV